MMPHSFPEQRFDVVGRLPHHAAGQVPSAASQPVEFAGTRSHPSPEWVTYFAGDALPLRPGTPPRLRSASSLAGPTRMLNQPVLPHRQERVLENNCHIEPPPLDPAPEERAYRDANGLITMCVACHRMQRPETEQWDRIPEWEASPPDQVTGGLCTACFQEHYARYLPAVDDAVA